MKQQRKANRLSGYDYSQDNLYFVTSCVHNMVCCFGDVVMGPGGDLSDDDNLLGTGHDLSLQEPRMILNDYGKIADRQWHWLAEQYPYVILHEFIVMPNHIHGIIEIRRDAIVGTGHDLSGNNYETGTGHGLSGNNHETGTGHGLSGNNHETGTGHDLSGNNHETGTGHDLSGNNHETGTGHDLSLLKIKSLSGLMGAYKTTVSKKIHLLKYDEFAWQRSFYDHIIRDEKSYEKISNYIINNPNTWQQDKFFNK